MADTLNSELSMEAPLPAPAKPHWPGFFKIFLEPKAYGALLYLLLSMPLGIFAFTWVTTGMGLSLGFMILIIGLPFLLLWLLSCRALGWMEARSIQFLMGEKKTENVILPKGMGVFEKAKGLFTDKFTWLSLVYLLLKLPLGIVHFTVLVTGVALSAALTAAPMMLLWTGEAIEILGQVYEPTSFTAILCLGLSFLLGLLLIVLFMHAFYGLARLQSWLARTLLG